MYVVYICWEVGKTPFPIPVCMYRDMYVAMSDKSYNHAVSKKSSFTGSWEEALISQTLTL